MEKDNLISAKENASSKKEAYNKIATFPAVNISETKDNFQIILEVPGFSHKDITIQSMNSRLYISGERTENPSDNTRTRISTERKSYFRWVYDLKEPFGKKDLSIALENGFLFITVPKTRKGTQEHTENIIIENYIEDNIYFPRANVVETSNHIEMSLEIPGYKNNDVSIKVVESSLTITGKRSLVLLNKEQQYLRIEIPFRNSFLRRFELPENVNPSQVSWNVQHGVLYVYLPKLKVIRKEEVARETMLS
jgi:HSP20 family protein